MRLLATALTALGSRRPFCFAALPFAALVAPACGLTTSGFDVGQASPDGGGGSGGAPDGGSGGAIAGSGGQGGEGGGGGHGAGGGEPCGAPWSDAVGAPYDAQGTGVDVDASGNTIVAGYFQGAMSLGGQTLLSHSASVDLFLAKLDRAGDLVWSKAFGDAGSQVPLSLNGYGLSVAADASGNIVLTGALTGAVDFGGGPLTSAGLDDIFVAKFDPTGKHQWSKRFGDASGQGARGVAIDPSGAAWIVGELEGSADFGGGPLSSMGSPAEPDSAFVVKLAPDGSHVWSQRFHDAVAVAVAVDAAGAAFVTGGYSGSSVPNFGGGPLVSAGADVQSFVVKLDAAGKHVWSAGYGGPEHQYTISIAVAPGGDPVVTGTFTGNLDFGAPAMLLKGAAPGDMFVAKLAGADGKGIWAKQFGDAGGQTAFDVDIDATGNVLLTGELAQSANFGCGPITAAGISGNPDVFVAKLTPTGGCLAAKRFGDGSVQRGVSVAVTACGDAIVTGRFIGSLDFGQGAMVAAIQDGFVAKLSL